MFAAKVARFSRVEDRFIFVGEKKRTESHRESMENLEKLFFCARNISKVHIERLRAGMQVKSSQSTNPFR